ncbi:MAG: DNA-processing protein DprA [Candidatus Accumulibacter sp.]|jgi:predicted Rossmann fold nucleotide-binding protein DprA/Smf involved in DNA uptake|nr:DNA-processing protein DprA [Accumulibacter sp.]
MTPVPLTLPPRLAQRLPPEQASRLIGVGNANLLAELLLGFIASRACPANVLIETLDLVAQWARAGRVLVSGFHSPLEQQVLTSLLRRQGRAVKVLARGMRDYWPDSTEKNALDENRLLVLTAFPPTIARTTRATALERNRLVLQLASERYIPHIAPGSRLRNWRSIWMTHEPYIT